MDATFQLQTVLRADPFRWHVLKVVQRLDLPDSWIGAGFVRNAVWDHSHKRAPLAGDWRSLSLLSLHTTNISPTQLQEVGMSKPEVYIIESLDLADENRRKEGEVLSRTMRLSGKRPIYKYIRTRRELEYFVDDFKKSEYRYLHISCHGNNNLISLTLNRLNNSEFASVVGSALDGRRLFLSACLATTEDLASKIFQAGKCLSVAGPLSKINFDDAAIFWSTFYHIMFKKQATGMASRDIVAAMMGVSWAIAEQFHFFRPKKDGSVSSLILPSTSLFDKRIGGLLTTGM